MTLDRHPPVVGDGARVGVEVPNVEVVGQEAVLVVPHDLEGDLRILRVEVGEGQAGDVAL